MSLRIPRGASLTATLALLFAAAVPPSAGAQPAATTEWATYFGGNGHERVTAIARSPDNDFVVVGTTTSQSLEPDAGTTGTLGSRNIFVAIFTSEFEFLAKTTFGGTADDVPTAVAATRESNLDYIYIAGWTRSPDSDFPVKFNSYSGNDDAFVARLRLNRPASSSKPSLSPDWFMYLNGTMNEVATGLVVTPVITYVSGWTSSANFLSDTAGPTPTMGEDGFVVKLTLDAGMPKVTPWGLGLKPIIGGTGSDRFQHMLLDGTKLLLVGTTTSPTIPGKVVTGYHGPAGLTDALVVQMDTVKGEPDWLTYVGGNNNDEGNAIGVLSLEPKQYVIAGTAQSTDTIPAPPIPSGKNAFAVWLDTEGRQKHVRSFGGTGEDEALSLYVDGHGTTYVGGKTSSSTGFFNASNHHAFDTTSAGGEGFVVAIPKAGGEGWGSFIGGTMADEVTALSGHPETRLMVGMQTTSNSGLPAPADGGRPLYDGTLSATDGYLAALNIVDPSPPGLIIGRVYDRPQADAVYEDISQVPASKKTIAANWDEFKDFNSAIAKYEWAIGTQEEPELVQKFTSIELARSIQASPVPLDAGVTYIVTVRAQNTYGLTGLERSDGVLVIDDSPPIGKDGGTDGGTGGNDGGTGGTDGGSGGNDAGTGGNDGGSGGNDGGSGGNDGGSDAGPGGPGENPDDVDPPLGWGCASAGGAGLPLVLGLIVFVLLARRLGHRPE